MYELDKKEFGAFLVELRKQKKMTQKELAQQLFVSDKAVSKWERGLNMPDITLLIPLAQALGVSVTELLEGRRMPSNEPMNATQVEALVKKAITMTEEDSQVLKQRRKTYCRLLIGCLILTAAEYWILLKSGYGQLVSVSNIAVMELLSIIFGIYFCVGIKEKLPAYYDENSISAYSDGIFRINLAGVHFNNRNWPHIVQAGRIWSLITMVVMPPYYVWIDTLPLPNYGMVLAWVLPFLGTLLIPMFYLGRKYE